MERYLGESVPKLGFGLMRLPLIGDKIDVEQTKEMVDLFMANGFRYFDTAYGYNAGESEKTAKLALVDRYPRDSFLLATKLPAWAGANTREEAEQMFYTSLERTGAGYFDFYLLHNMGEARTKLFEDYKLWDFIAARKAEGLIRHIGFSFHDKASSLDEILTAHPEAEFVQLQINYADWENVTVESRKCYETARKHGKPVVIMEPVKGGNLARLPEEVASVLREANPEASQASWAIRFAASLDGVIAVLSGMSNVEQMKENISFMKDFKPLTDNERETIMKASSVLSSFATIPCTACAYCMKGCPQSIAIFSVFQAVNLASMYRDLASAKGSYNWNTTGHGMGKASDCIGCGQCEAVCPQHIHIREELEKAVEMFEK